MSHYKTNLRDIEFNLFEVHRIQDHLGADPFGDVDLDTARALIREIERLALTDLAASFVEADRVPLEVDADGEVALPAGVRRSLDAFYEGGWDRLGLPPSLGGIAAPPSLYRMVQELLVGANPALYFYVIGSLMARIIDAVGTDEQRRRFAVPMVERRWGGTMVLTEPDAGSDVGAGITKAHHVAGDVYHLEGVKRFITSGENDYFENIVHLVLARRDGGPPGTKGLSMFIVPKYLVNPDGSLGSRNGVRCTALEKKMGIKGSATCELTFGLEEPAVGHLVGEVHEGIRQMFLVIEEARMLIGIKSTATLSTGYLNALEFARERIQGPDLAQAADKTAPRVPIISHPEVRRMLMSQKAHAEGLRALVSFTGWVQDQAQLHPDNDSWRRLDDLLLPVVKGYASEKSYQLLSDSLQVHGGSGFTQDYPIEQYVRDAKIDTLYEGTTGIQALDLFFRKIVRDRGETLTRLGAMVQEFVKGGAGNDSFAVEREALGAALEDVQAHVGAMAGAAMAARQAAPEIYKAGLHANALLESLAEVVIGWQLLRHAEIATRALDSGDQADRSFYEGKVAAGRWFARTVLPKTGRRRRLAETEDGAVMELAVAAF